MFVLPHHVSNTLCTKHNMWKDSSFYCKKWIKQRKGKIKICLKINLPFSFYLILTRGPKKPPDGFFQFEGCFPRWHFGVCFIRMFEKNN